MYQEKYMKYKNKYLELKSKIQIQNGDAKTKAYLIHDNGGRPLKCVIDKDTIYVHKQNDHESDEVVYDKKPSLIFHPKEIYIGKSPLNKMTEFSGGYGPEFDGNTILLDMGNNEYIFIGSEIWSFDAVDKITKYISPVGNNDVPYPYAIDKSGNIYLIVDNVIIMHRDDIAEQMDQYDNPYDYYYDYDLITADRGMVPPQLPKTDMGIDKWMVGKNQYTLRYKPFPEIRDRDEMYIIDSKGKKTRLSEEGYMDLMNKFAELQSFEPLPKKKIYMDRDIGGTLLGQYMAAISQL